MMKPKILLLLVGVLAINLLTACGYMKSLFPDKEKDYQYTSEIPALVLPADLARDDGIKLIAPPKPMLPADGLETTAVIAPATTPSPVLPEPSPPATPSLPTSPNVDGTDKASAVEPTVEETPLIDGTSASSTPIKREPIPVAIQKSASGADALQLSAPFETAWRAVDKALSRNSIEVTTRDKAEKAFTLRYDPDEKALDDQSFWHEVFFLFNRLNSNEQEFTLKLTEQGQQTQAIVLDKGQKPATDASATRLLNLLQETIKSDFAK